MTPWRGRSSEAVVAAWNGSVPPKYRLDAELVEANLFQHPLLHETASGWQGDAFIAMKRSAAELYAGPNPKVAHLSLLGGRRADLSVALTHSLETLREEGFEAVVIGQDSGHFLPGAPTDVPWLGWFLKSAGFERGDFAFDLQRDVRDLPAEEERELAGTERRILEERDVESLDRFLAREFPGRWRYDVAMKIVAEGPSTVFGLIVEGEVQGFALLQGEGCVRPIGGAVWRNDLGPGWASLGPIGVSRDLRGHSHGVGLLNAALIVLRDRGARQTIIDWTGLLDFYGTQGFSVARSYRPYRLSLRADRES